MCKGGLIMKLGIVIFPTKDMQDVANSFRKRYDPKYKLISPHLTLKEAFSVEEAELDGIVNELEKISAETQPFSLHFGKVSHFHPTNNVIYFACDENSQLEALHDKLHSGPGLSHERKFAFVPHVTIGQEMSDDELHDIYGRLRMENYSFNVTVKQFHLLHQLENETWSIYQSFSLKN